MNQKLLALYGLKWNPFTPDVPTEALYVPPNVENFCWRIEQAHLREGGFALIHGDPSSGKSVVMRLLAERLARLAELSVGVIHHPQSNLSDFYRELGDIFGISMRVSNRWGGFKALRARWVDHLLTTAGNADLMTEQLRHTLCDHAVGNYRIFIAMAAELLMSAAQRDIPVLDEKLYLQVFAQPQTHTLRRATATR